MALTVCVCTAGVCVLNACRDTDFKKGGSELILYIILVCGGCIRIKNNFPQHENSKVYQCVLCVLCVCRVCVVCVSCVCRVCVVCVVCEVGGCI